MKPVRIEGPTAIGATRRGWSGPALAVSAGLHGLLIVAAVGLARSDEAAAARAEAARANDPTVQLLYVPPAPRRAPVAMPRAPAARPNRPAAPPMRQVPEHDQPAGATAPESPAPEPVPEPPAADAPALETETAVAAEPSAAASASLMHSEAERIFGRRSRSRAPEGGPAADPGFEIYLPRQSDGCTPVPPRRTGEPIELATVSGRVYREGTRIPLAGAHLQMIGTPYVAFSDDTGGYDLRFDPSLVDRCRTQYVRVTAPGFRAQTLVLYLGPAAANDIPMSRR